MIRVVIDTNILVSALLQPESLPAAVFMLALSGQVQLCVSGAVFAEYDEVIRRPRLKRSPDVIEGTLQSIRKHGHWVKPNVRVEECSDPDDNVFLECAQAAEADYMVTGNQRHFPERWKKTKVIGARELIELLIDQEN
ncbi:MAG: putative toxin-antitoxin system toxin component, PIN family [Bryobacteraceae bacterium]